MSFLKHLSRLPQFSQSRDLTVSVLISDVFHVIHSEDYLVTELQVILSVFPFLDIEQRS